MKKKQLYGLIFALFIMLLAPSNISAKEAKVTCKYQYQDKELVYTIDSQVEVPFQDGNNNWYHGQNFKENYLESAMINSSNYVCPTITIEESNLFTTVYSSPKNLDKCNGKCTTLQAVNYTSKENITLQKAVDTTAICSVGIYKEDKYFIPYFRLLEDGSKEWSIDGKRYYSVDDNIIINISDTKTKISLDKELVESIYKNNALNSSITIYRNVKETNNGYEYLLSIDKNNNYNLTDGQELRANSYNGAYGDPDMENWDDDYNQSQDCDSLLGNPNQEGTVAELLKIALNWLKLIGPFIVLVKSGIEFTKVVVMGDDDSMKKAQRNLIIRLILALALFFLPDVIAEFLEMFNITSSGICGLE